MDSGGAWPSTKYLSSLTSARKYIPSLTSAKKFIPGQQVMPSIPGIKMQSFNRFTQGNQIESNNQLSGSIFQYVVLAVLTFFIGVLFTYIFNKDKVLGFDAMDKGIVVVCMVLIGLGGSYIFKANLIDFLISSEINILCIYLLISYIGITTFSGSSPWLATLKFFRTISNIVVDPTNIFKTGYSLIIPLILLVIPLLVLIYDFTKNIYMTILVLGVSAGIVYTLYPKNNAIPIQGGTPLLGPSGPTCIKHWYDNLNPNYWGLNPC